MLGALRWSAEDLDPDYPVRWQMPGSEHLVLVTKTSSGWPILTTTSTLSPKLMRDYGLVTVQLVWPESKKRYHSRNPLLAGSGRGSRHRRCAAAFGGYLRELGMIGRTASFTISQGVDMGRPSEINVSVIAGEPGVRVAGAAHRIDG